MSFLSTIQTTTTTRQHQGSAIFYQITSAQTVQAFVVVVLVTVMAYLVVTGQDVPEAVATFVGVVMGYYFRGGDSSSIVGDPSAPPSYDPEATRDVDVSKVREDYFASRSLADDDAASTNDQAPPA